MVELIWMIAVFAFAFVIGHMLISRVPQMLHAPLMSMTNAISAVTILGALLLFSKRADVLEKTLAAVALAAAAFNVVGGFVITDRMLGLFRRKGRDNDGA
ncbi:MAG: NAD(P) transhydrogenase subunit alpha [Planctomycetes bacterium]|nr:NAD(P) transhydrogenase subunit alpha [Planctomycetota bacterium]